MEAKISSIHGSRWKALPVWMKHEIRRQGNTSFLWNHAHRRTVYRNAKSSLFGGGSSCTKSRCFRLCCRQFRFLKVQASNDDGEVCDKEPDWDREMSIFKKRVNKPSHLEALRKIEAERVDVGRVCILKHVPIMHMVSPVALSL